MGAGIGRPASGEHVYLWMYACVFVLHARERRRQNRCREGSWGWRGFNSREADGAEGRRLMQHRARKRKTERDLEQIGWKSDNFTVPLLWACYTKGCWMTAAHTEALRHLWIKAKMDDKFHRVSISRSTLVPEWIRNIRLILVLDLLSSCYLGLLVQSNNRIRTLLGVIVSDWHMKRNVK